MHKPPKKITDNIDNPEALVGIIEKTITKDKFLEYELEKIGNSILQLKKADYYSEVCLKKTYSEKAQDIFSQIIFNHYFELNDSKNIQKLIDNGYKFKIEKAMYRLSEKLKMLDSEEKDTILEVFKQFDWSQINKKAYAHIYGEKNLEKMFEIVGENNFTQEEIQHIFRTNMPNCTKPMLKRLISLGATMYPGGVLDDSFLNENCYFPQKGSYGYITLRGRQNITELLKDKNINNPAWVNFIKRSFLSDNSDVKIHLTQLIRNKIITPEYDINKKNFYKLLCHLEPEEIKAYKNFFCLYHTLV